MLHNKLPSLSCYCLSYSFSCYFPLVSVYFFQSTVFIILNSNKNSDVRWSCQNLWKSTTWYLVLRQKLLKILVFTLFACLLSQVWNTYIWLDPQQEQCHVAKLQERGRSDGWKRCGSLSAHHWLVFGKNENFSTFYNVLREKEPVPYFFFHEDAVCMLVCI